MEGPPHETLCVSTSPRGEAYEGSLNPSARWRAAARRRWGSSTVVALRDRAWSSSSQMRSVSVSPGALGAGALGHFADQPVAASISSTCGVASACSWPCIHQQHLPDGCRAPPRRRYQPHRAFAQGRRDFHILYRLAQHRLDQRDQGRDLAFRRGLRLLFFLAFGRRDLGQVVTGSRDRAQRLALIVVGDRRPELVDRIGQQQNLDAARAGNLPDAGCFASWPDCRRSGNRSPPDQGFIRPT